VSKDPASDPVVCVLANIYNPQTQQGSLAGQAYKSVEVIVEGSPTFVKTGVEGGGVFVTLDYVQVAITDNNILNLYRAATGQAKATPQLAAQQALQPVQQQAQAAAPQQMPRQAAAQPVLQQPSVSVAPQTSAVDLAAQSQVISGPQVQAPPQQPAAQQLPSAKVQGATAGASVKQLLSAVQPGVPTDNPL